MSRQPEVWGAIQQRRALLTAALLLLAACGAAPYVGTKDCKVITAEQPHDPFYDTFYNTCEHCQGRSCEHMDCRVFPCRDERRIVQACKKDEDCKDLPAAHCGEGGAEHGICVISAAQ
jgi:hypothetical protein